MSDKHKSLPIIIGVSILFIVPISIGGLIYSSLGGNDTEAETGQLAESNSENSPFASAERKQSIKTAPTSTPENTGGGSGVMEPTEGIPTGKYSNPPTTIPSFEGNHSINNRPFDNFDSSVERNQSSQQNTNSSTRDYSNPAASNNFNRTEDNSLVKPIEDDSFLRVSPSDTDEEASSISPVPASLFGK